MGNNNYPQAKLDLGEILEYANSDINNLDKQRILKQKLPLLQSYAKERDLSSVIDLLESFPVNLQDEFWRECDENTKTEIEEIFQVNNIPKDKEVIPGSRKVKARNKPKINRTSQLHELIMKIALEMAGDPVKKPPARKLMKKIERDFSEYDEEAIIQEVTEEGIYWKSKYGNEQSLPWSSFPATFSRLWKNKKINTKK